MKILLAHGSSDSAHAKEVVKLAGAVTQLLGEAVEAAFLSDDRLPDGSEVLPLFLGAGKHVSEDIPALAKHSRCRLLPPLGEQSTALAALVGHAQVKRMFVIYQSEGFEALAGSLRTHGAIAMLHGKPSVTSILKQLHSGGAAHVTVQPMLLFPGKSLARLRRMIAESTMPDASVAPVLCELDGFTELVASCFRNRAA